MGRHLTPTKIIIAVVVILAFLWLFGPTLWYLLSHLIGFVFSAIWWVLSTIWSMGVWLLEKIFGAILSAIITTLTMILILPVLGYVAYRMGYLDRLKTMFASTSKAGAK